MRPLAALERFLERLFERPTARLMGARLEPVTLVRRLERAIDEERRAAADGMLAPTRFVIEVSPADAAALAGMASLEDDLATAALDHARRRGYRIPERPSVALLGVATLDPGDVRVIATFADGLRAPAVAGHRARSHPGPSRATGHPTRGGSPRPRPGPPGARRRLRRSPGDDRARLGCRCRDRRPPGVPAPCAPGAAGRTARSSRTSGAPTGPGSTTTSSGKPSWPRATGSTSAATRLEIVVPPPAARRDRRRAQRCPVGHAPRLPGPAVDRPCAHGARIAPRRARGDAGSGGRPGQASWSSPRAASRRPAPSSPSTR